MIDVVVLFFLLGVFARLVKSDLRLPEALYETLAIYLLLAIGLKGGIELSRQPLAVLAPQVLACTALGFAIPFVMFPVLRALRLTAVDAAAGLHRHATDGAQPLQHAVPDERKGLCRSGLHGHCAGQQLSCHPLANGRGGEGSACTPQLHL